MSRLMAGDTLFGIYLTGQMVVEVDPEEYVPSHGW